MSAQVPHNFIGGQHVSRELAHLLRALLSLRAAAVPDDVFALSREEPPSARRFRDSGAGMFSDLVRVPHAQAESVRTRCRRESIRPTGPACLNDVAFGYELDCGPICCTTPVLMC